MSLVNAKIRKPETERFYNTVREEFELMSSKKKFGARVYTNDYIFAYLANKHFKAPKTIENIVFNRV